MDAVSLRRKDTTRGPPLRVLSLDGGGVRGYSMLIILKELMHRAFVETEGRPPRHEEIPKPCEYFDLIGGTGTGGLIAIMLGRLRLDLDTSMDVYVRMTRKVFETDKTIAGIPYKTTLFKASKLEEAIKACVMEHTIYEDEGNDGAPMISPSSAVGSTGNMSPADMRRSLSMRSTASLPRTPENNRNSVASSIGMGMGMGARNWGDPDARLYDGRPNRTKTAVTAVFKGTPKTGSSVLLRSYDSRKEPAQEHNCTIWQAGRATSATGLAFKPIQIGQSVFIDEGAGKYNPSPQLLEEAVVNEWPGRELGVFVSVGTGKRPGSSSNANQHEWWESLMGGSSVGLFAEARRRLMTKIEDCETTHIQMMNVELPKRGIPADNYCRLNVEVGVGEFGMNEWDRMPEMTTNTAKYLKADDTQRMIGGAAHRLARIELMRRRMTRTDQPGLQHAYGPEDGMIPTIQGPQQHWPPAVELPGSDIRMSPTVQPHYRTPSNPPYPDDQTVSSHELSPYGATSPESKHRISAELSAYASKENFRYSPQQESMNAPPLPPKTPINDVMNTPPARLSPLSFSPRPQGLPQLPYPEDDGPPPPMTKLRKPEYIPR